MKRRAVPAIPFALSLLLSVATVGAHPYWQDSGLYLTAIKELGVLYPPGFTLYEVLVHAWTRALFFVDFTLAVHLFSSLCAAGASAAIALAVRDFLESKGRVFGVTGGDTGGLAPECGILAGALLAAGYTFWSTAILAKVYAFYFLILALLLWRMIRADESGRPRDFTIVAVLIGLAWQAHPSSVAAGIALVLFVASQAKTLGARGILGRVLVAAATAVGPTLILLPILVSRDPWLMFSRPATLIDYLRFISGGHYAGEEGAFGPDAGRAASTVRFFWEDLLGVGLLLLAVGFASIARRNRRLLIGILAWFVPYAVFAVLFKTEVQYDCWLVGARMPLFLVMGLGAWEVGTRAAGRGVVLLRGLAAAATAWAVAANYGDLNQRDYLPAEWYARSILETADPDAIVLLSGDDSNGLVSYLQRVRGVRRDVILVTSSFLNGRTMSGRLWYDEGLRRRSPDLKPVDYDALRERFPSADRKQLATAAFVNAQAGGPRVILSENPIRPEMLRPDLTQVPAGVFVRISRTAETAAVEERYWRFPVEPEQVRPMYRRARGQDSTIDGDGLHVKAVRYERRLAALILRARYRLALSRFDAGGFADSARLCQSIVDFDDEEFETNPLIVHLLGVSYYGAGQFDRAVPALRRSVEISPRPENRAMALLCLGAIARKKGDDAAARQYDLQAQSVPGVDSAVLRAMAGRLGPR